MCYYLFINRSKSKLLQTVYSSMYKDRLSEIHSNLEVPNKIWTGFKHWYCYAITYETHRYETNLYIVIGEIT